jgi:hypothetical protein
VCIEIDALVSNIKVYKRGSEMNDAKNIGADVPRKAPTATSRKWLSWLLGFGVTVPLGLAPFLGNLDVPGFSPLLSLFPELPFNTQTIVIPISSFVMGVMAVIVQFFSEDKHSKKTVRNKFYRSVILMAFFGICLVSLHTITVVQKPLQGSDRSVSVMVGFSRPETCKECTQEMSNVECLTKTSLDPSRILTCWIERQIQISFLLLFLSYLVVTGCFGWMIGLLIVRRRLRPVERSKRGSG